MSDFSQIRKHNIKLWHRWYKMQQRVHGKWEHYEDITICAEWDMEVSGAEQAFLNFWEDMGDTFEEHLMLDRIDPTGHYEPDNCRWVTATVSANNLRKHHTEYGVWLTWARSHWGDTQTTRIRYWRRVKRLGWSCESAARTPPGDDPV